jgi:hypothetical protein
MGFPGYRRSVRASLAYVGMAAATASALAVLQSGMAFGAAVIADKITVTPGSGSPVTVQEGDNTGGVLVATFTDTGNSVRVNCEEQYVATINWGDGSTSTGTVTCEFSSDGELTFPTGTFDVTGSHTYADSASAAISVSVVDNSESAESSGAAVKTDTATVTDADLELDGDNSTRHSYSAVEGKSIKVAVDFFDNGIGDSARDASITGTIDWGDGSALQTVPSTAASDICDCSSNDAEISATHVYDGAAAFYHITVTAKDDGGSTASASYTANISDGKLTADANKSLTATAGAAFTSVLGSFTDEAAGQAAAGDFAAMVNWGDGALYPGTVTKTASGAFSVSGTHTYASAGSKSITATVTDEEGSTVTLHATATVGAAPVVLPATGQPHPTQPAIPVIPLVLVILCLASLAIGGRVLVKMPR